MRAHDGAVDHRVFVIGIGSQVLENPLPNPRFRPAAVTAMDVLPVAKAFGQVAPGNPRPVAIQHRLDKQTVVRRRHSDLPLTPRKQIANPLPLIVPQAVASHRSAPKSLTPHESNFAPLGNPLNDDRP